MGIEPGIRNAPRHVGHRRWQKPTSAGTNRSLVLVIELVGRASQYSREHSPRSVIDSQASAKLTWVMPAHRLPLAGIGRKLRKTPRRELDERLDTNGKRCANLVVEACERQRASTVDGDHARVSFEHTPDHARVSSEGFAVAGEPQGQTAALRYQ
jgi:hypothetical protein